MTQEFDKSLRRIAKPAIEPEGFVFDGKRRFVKATPNGEELVIEYQVGTRFVQGTFTVNLIADQRFARLGMIRPTKFSKLIHRLFGKYDPWWKNILLPKDKWWKMSPFQSEMDSIIEKTVADLKSYGISWLEDSEKNH